MARRSKGIGLRRRLSRQGEYDYDKDRLSDINKARRLGEEYHKELKRQGEDNFNK